MELLDIGVTLTYMQFCVDQNLPVSEKGVNLNLANISFRLPQTTMVTSLSEPAFLLNQKMRSLGTWIFISISISQLVFKVLLHHHEPLYCKSHHHHHGLQLLPQSSTQVILESTQIFFEWSKIFGLWRPNS